MERHKTIKYISETSINDMVNNIKDKNMDVNYVIDSTNAAIKELVIKTDLFFAELRKMIGELEVGMIIDAKMDCMNNFRKGQRCELTEKRENGFVVDGVVELSEYHIMKFFKVVG